MEQLKIITLIVGLTILAGFADSQGFIHAANIWAGGKPAWGELVKSGLGFGTGILLYWIVLRHVRVFRVVAPEMQTIVWFGVTIVGVALLSGKFMQWRAIDQLVAAGVLLGIVWLLFRTGG